MFLLLIAIILRYYEFVSPKLIVRDLELTRKVLIKDFSYFVDHVSEADSVAWDAQLFMLSGNKWKALRYVFKKNNFLIIIFFK